MQHKDDPIVIPQRLPKLDPSKGRWAACSDAAISKIVVQGDDKEEVIQKAKLKGCQPPILIMEIKNEDCNL